MSAIMFYDVETTGLSAEKNALIEVAFQPVIDGEKLPTKVFKIRPFEGAIIEDGALKVNGYTREEIMTWPTEAEVIPLMIEYLDSFEKKFKHGGHNVQFDRKFLKAFFCRNMQYGAFFTLFRSNYFCTYEISKDLKIKSKSNKLKDLCDFYEIPLEGAHKAENDIIATVLLYEKLEPQMIKLRPSDGNMTYQQKRRKYIDTKYVIFNPEGDVFINKEAFKDKEAMKFIIGEMWDLYCDED